MTESSQILNQLKKADKLARLNMHEFGPHSYQRGIGRLLRTLADHDGAPSASWWRSSAGAATT